jgi:DNA-binding transcriptional regulator YiaG
VIYYANRLAPADAAQLGKVVGETRPTNTSVVFEAKTAARSVLQFSKSAARKSAAASGTRISQWRERFGLTQMELAQAIGVSLRTVQNWERAGVVSKPRRLRDLEELWTILKNSMKSSEILAWLQAANDAFSGERPIDLLKDGKTRDIIVEFRRLQAGEPA